MFGILGSRGQLEKTEDYILRLLIGVTLICLFILGLA